MLTLEGHRILVSGASSGLGKAISYACASAGALVIGCGRDAARLEATIVALPGGPHAAEIMDFSAPESIPEWMKQTAARHGRISGLVHSAGVLVTKPLRLLSTNDWEQSWRVNVQAAAWLVRGLHQKDVKAPGDASIVFLSSVTAFTGQPGQSLYAATKGALTSMTRSLAVEYARERTRVNSVAPAVIETPMTDRLRDAMTPEQFDNIVSMHPLGLGRPEDVAHAVAFLLSPLARWITGTTLVVDGGYTAH